MTRALLTRARLSAVLCAAALSVLALAAPAQAKTIEQIVHTGSFDGSGSSVGPFTSGLQNIAINQANGNVLAMDSGHGGALSQFDFAGVASPFSDPGLGGASSITVGFGGEIALDTSATITAGRIYVLSGNGEVSALAPSGAQIAGFVLGGFHSPCGLAVAPDANLWVSEWGSNQLVEFLPSGAASGETVSTPHPCAVAIDSAANFYVAEGFDTGRVRKYSAAGALLNDNFDPNRALAIAVDRSNDHVYLDKGDHVDVYDAAGSPLTSFGGPDAPFAGVSDSRGVAVSQSTHEVYLSSQDVVTGSVEVFEATGAVEVPDVQTATPDVSAAGATLRGSVDADGAGDTDKCFFQWGIDTKYTEGDVPCTEGSVFSGDGPNPVSAAVTGLLQGVTYHYRLVATNANGVRSAGADRSFHALGKPILTAGAVSDVNTDGARLGATIDPNGAATTYQFQWGPDGGPYDHTVPIPAGSLAGVTAPESKSTLLGGLAPGATYHFRVLATNEAGTSEGPDHTFTTFPSAPSAADPCPNSHVRQQTGTALLLDCRAYELVSAADAGGNDVQSDLISGQTALASSPLAPGRVLYSLHSGTVPGVGEGPSNYGSDPYLAARGPSGWSTTYVGIPATPSPSTVPFGSPLLGTDAGLATFAFGGAGLCDPCFGDGSVGIPVRLAGGQLVQGMAGSLDPGPAATPAGYVRQPLSANGRHLIFGSASAFEPGGSAGPDVSIYDRDLATGVTRLISKTPGGATMSGPGIAELAISGDGERILVAQQASADAAGNPRYRLYLAIAGSPQSVAIAPSVSAGVLFDGMSADGSAIFFTTEAKLLGADSDVSADIYAADVGADGAVSLRLVSAGGAGSCDPIPSQDGPHWNSADAAGNCGALAFAGGAGLASGDGSLYFLSPQKLGGSGTQDAPNLFLARPGSAPHFIATLEPANQAIHNAVYDNEAEGNADIQVSPDGNYALFPSALPLTPYNNLAHTELYHYNAQTDTLACASCAPTGAAPATDTRLSPAGLNLADDGRVFFTSAEPLVLRDTNERADAYEWNGAQTQLISTGTGDFASGLMSVSADGTDAFFYTRETLVPSDQNGHLVKIYDARAGGGFPFDPPAQPCKASDECHGPGTQAAAAPAIQTVGAGAQGTRAPIADCRKGFLKRHGKCVRKPKQPAKKKRHHKRAPGSSAGARK